MLLHPVSTQYLTGRGQFSVREDDTQWASQCLLPQALYTRISQSHLLTSGRTGLDHRAAACESTLEILLTFPHRTFILIQGEKSHTLTSTWTWKWMKREWFISGVLNPSSVLWRLCFLLADHMATRCCLRALLSGTHAVILEDVPSLFSSLPSVSAVGTSTRDSILLMIGAFEWGFGTRIRPLQYASLKPWGFLMAQLGEIPEAQSRVCLKLKRKAELLSWDRINFKFHGNHNVLSIKIWIFFYISQETVSSLILRRQSLPQSGERPNFVLCLLIFCKSTVPVFDETRLVVFSGPELVSIIPNFLMRSVLCATKPSASHTRLTRFIPKWLALQVTAVIQLEWKKRSFPAGDNRCMRFRSFYTNESESPICDEDNGRAWGSALSSSALLTISSLDALQMGDSAQSSQVGFCRADAPYHINCGMRVAGWLNACIFLWL